MDKDAIKLICIMWVALAGTTHQCKVDDGEHVKMLGLKNEIVHGDDVLSEGLLVVYVTGASLSLGVIDYFAEVATITHLSLLM